MSDHGPGRVTTRPYVTAAVVALALAVVWAVSSLGGGGGANGEPPQPTAVATPPSEGIREAALTGRLVFAASAPDGVPGLRQRLYVYDLFDRTITPGPRIPTARQISPLGDGSILILSDGVRGRIAPSLATSLDADAELRHLPDGNSVSASTDGRQISVLSASPHGCGDEPMTLERDFRFVIGSPNPLETRGRICGVSISAAAQDGSTAVSIVDDRGRVRTRIEGEIAAALDGTAILSIGPGDTALLVEVGRQVHPLTVPVGQLLVWPFAGDPRPAVDGLVATRVLAWSPDGGSAIVNGTLDGVRSMWLIDPATGTARPILPTERLDLGTAFSGATFDDTGTAYGASAAAIVAATQTGTYPLELPAGSPVPSGPIVWLP